MFKGPPTSDPPLRAPAADPGGTDSGQFGFAEPPLFICLNASLQRLMVQAEITVPRLQFATLEGAPGTGKSLFAQNIHRLSDLYRLHGLPFLRRDAREWLASDVDAGGMIGTLYLDRVDLLEPPGQSLLLNVIKMLQNDSKRPGRFLLLLSSQSSLRQLASQGVFLPDLAFRLTAVRFYLPPLRERREDIAPIAQALIDRICRHYQQPTAALGSGTLAQLLQHSWPGNVRELASVLESAILDSTTGQIRPADLALHLHQESAQSRRSSAAPEYSSREAQIGGDRSASLDRVPPFGAGTSLSEDLTLDSAIRRHIQLVLDLFHGNKLQAAKQLAISRSTLYRLLASSGLQRSPEDAADR